VSGYVLDASVAVTALTEPGSGAADLLADTDAVFQAPSIFDVEVISALRGFYADCPFVQVLDTAPRVKDVVTSNFAHLSAAANGRTVAVMCVLDNLTKGAAGGALQWMNRLFGLPETAGLTAPAPGWT